MTEEPNHKNRPYRCGDIADIERFKRSNKDPSDCGCTSFTDATDHKVCEASPKYEKTEHHSKNTPDHTQSPGFNSRM